MGLFSVKGVLTALGPATITKDGTLYSYIEITRTDGRRIMVTRVGVSNLGSRGLEMDNVEAEFFFDKVFLLIPPSLPKFLYGVRRTDGISVFDPANARLSAAFAHIVIGLLLSIVMVGLLPLAIGLLQLVRGAIMAGAREQAFYGGPAHASHLRQEEAIRI